MPTHAKEAPVSSLNLHLLTAQCTQSKFSPGDVIRRKGIHYRDMLLIIDGEVDVNVESDRGETIHVSEPGSPIGEIAFLRGWPATATVTARTATRALVIDDRTLVHLEECQPALTADFLRYCADKARERASSNLTWESSRRQYHRSNHVEVLLCRNRDMLEEAKRLRYEVYCQELGRQSPYANHTEKTISDELDKTAQVFIAVEGGKTIGTIRGNTAAESSLGVLEDLYRMKSSPHHPHATSICTKFIVKRSKRGGPAAMKLIAAIVSYGLHNQIKECFIDSVPALLPYYRAIGFTLAGEPFVHRENGVSHPMRLDLVRHGARLSKESGLREYVTILMKANAFKFFSAARRFAAFGQ
jgi:CRP-like cAMP-binding protein